MSNQTFNLIVQYNTDAMKNLRALGDLNVSSVQWFINKQIELTNTVVELATSTGKEISAAKTPVEAIQSSGKLVQNLTDTVTGYVKDSTANAVKSRDKLKTVIDQSIKLNSEFSGKIVESGVEEVKNSAKKVA